MMGGKMKCPECGRAEFTEIQISLKDEDSVRFYSCRYCEAKWWENESGRVPLDEVLGLAAKR